MITIRMFEVWYEDDSSLMLQWSRKESSLCIALFNNYLMVFISECASLHIQDIDTHLPIQQLYQLIKFHILGNMQLSWKDKEQRQHAMWQVHL